MVRASNSRGGSQLCTSPCCSLVLQGALVLVEENAIQAQYMCEMNADALVNRPEETVREYMLTPPMSIICRFALPDSALVRDASNQNRQSDHI